mgnify:CR=1 FL=1
MFQNKNIGELENSSPVPIVAEGTSSKDHMVVFVSILSVLYVVVLLMTWGHLVLKEFDL